MASRVSRRNGLVGFALTTRSVEVGRRLRAWRLAAGLSAEALGEKLNMSRATVYRLEATGVARLDTLARVAALLDMPVETLLGVGVEYVPSAIAYFERLRQVEEQSDQMFVAFGPLVYLLTSDAYDRALREALQAQARSRPNGKRLLGQIDQLLEILAGRKARYRARQPAITNLLSLPELVRFARFGLATEEDDDQFRARQRAMAKAELDSIAAMLEAPPIGVQIGVLFDEMPSTSFSVMRGAAATCVVVSPFRLGCGLNIWRGIATVSHDSPAIELHSHLARDLWREAVGGHRAAEFIRTRLLPHRRSTGTLRAA